MSIPLEFPLKLDTEAVTICRRALEPLESLPVHEEVLRTLRRFEESPISSKYILFLRPKDLEDCQASFESFISSQREGSREREVAVALNNAIGDFSLTSQKEIEKDREARASRRAGPPSEDPGEVLQKKLRDEMLRAVFTGGPHKRLDIWGNVIEEPPESRIEAESTEPISDEETNHLLTGGTTQDHNKDMARRGAYILLGRGASLSSGGDTVVVGTVSKYLAKVKKADEETSRPRALLKSSTLDV